MSEGGDVVSLRLARKRKGRAERAATADQNRASHGRTKAERKAEAERREAEAQHLDRHEIER